MKKLILLLGFGACLFCAPLLSQDVTFSFENAQNTNAAGTDYYEVDVMIATTTPFKLGSGQLYFNYNPLAFGTNIYDNNKIVLTYPNGGNYILGQKDNWLGVVDNYGDFVENDNTGSRYSFSWQQSKEGDCINVNVSGTPTKLFHLKIEYINVAQPPTVCFESAPLFVDQTFTHCGNNDGTCTLADEDCIGTPGMQITNDNFDCSGAALLPLELLFFQVKKLNDSDVMLNWETANEVNTSHFEIERSPDGRVWSQLDSTPAAGFSALNLEYDFLDKNAHPTDAPPALLFYRLRMVDLDGSFKYSPVRSVSFQNEKAFSVYPNPTSWGVHLHFGKNDFEENNWLVKVYALDGRVALETTANELNNRIHFPPSMSAGIYQISIQQENGQIEFVERIVLVR